MDFKQWNNPSIEYRSAPFWAINGELSAERLKEQIQSMKQQGLGGAYFHSRSGLKDEFMGEKWFSCIRECLEYCKEIGFQLCLYDEDRYTSGYAGGGITRENPDYRLKFLVVRDSDEKVLAQEKIIARFAVLFDGDRVVSYRAVADASETRNGERYLVFCEGYCPTSKWFNDGCPLDMCNSEATDAFIQAAYEPYYEQFGEYFGTVIPSVFTDEIRIGWIEFEGRFLKDYVSCALYTKDGLRLFEEKYGYSLVRYLPELFYSTKENTFSKVSFDYMSLLSELFLKNYSQKIGKWCADRNIRFTGHLFLAEFFSTLLTGLQMPHFKAFGWPGMDMTSGDLTKLASFKMASSACNQYDKERVVCELYGCKGWDWKLENQRFHGDWQYALGVNSRCQHLSMYSMTGFGKKDYPASINYQSPWWDYYRNTEDYFGRLSYALTRGYAANNVLLICPQEGLLGYYRGVCGWKDPAVDSMNGWDVKWRKIVHTLLENHVCFDFGDEILLAEDAQIQSDGLHVGNRVYDTVAVMPMPTMRSSTAQLLNQFKNVHVLQSFPERTLGDVALNTSVCKVYDDVNQWTQALKGAVSVQNEHGEEETDLFSMIRKDGENSILFLASVKQGKEFAIRTKFAEDKKYRYRMDCKSGKICSVGKDEVIRFTKSILLLASDEVIDCESEQTFVPIKTIKISGPFEYRMQEENALPLDFCDLSCNGTTVLTDVAIDEADDWIHHKYGLGDREFYNSYQPWYENSAHMITPKDEYCVTIHFNAKMLPKTICFVAEENDYESIMLNGTSLSKTGGYWIDPQFLRYGMQNSLRIGENTIEIRFRYKTGFELENFYLLGEFGVETDVATEKIGRKNVWIGALNQRLERGDICQQKLPFYTGKLSYQVNIPYENESQVLLGLGAYKGTAYAVCCNGKRKENVFGDAFTDVTELLHEGENHAEIELAVGRGNILGPLHVKLEIVSPDEFLFSHPQWKREYTLTKNGLNSEIEIVYKEKNND